MKTYGLIGFPLIHSFSARYFTDKFAREEIDAEYLNFELEDIGQLKDLLLKRRIDGLNVTIPYKEAVTPFLDEFDEIAAAIGAVNVIKFIREKGKKTRLKGYNSDVHGFGVSLDEMLQVQDVKALILGTGGASKAVEYALKERNIEVNFVSRRDADNSFVYSELTPSIIKDFKLIVNTTPLGTFPNTDSRPDIPYDGIGEAHLLYDLVYNPAETKFLRKGKERGATIINGEKMLILQAEKAWEIWNKEE